MKRFIMGLMAVIGFASLQGCAQYDTPEYVEVETSETAFVVPLEDGGDEQAKFQSVSYLESKKVALKRIQIVHRWNQTGRMSFTGEWIDKIRVVKVNRAPVTREWDAERDKTKAIWLESRDSVGFSTGFNCTAMIKEEDASKFLYWNRGGSLSDVMDSEIRNRIMQVSFEIAQQYPLDTLRGEKQKIIDAVRKDVVPYFAERGITISMIGMYGGMTYENDAIQKAIDNVFIAQQAKAVNLAAFEAQQKANEKIELEAKALAERARTEASGRADAKVAEAEGEAKSLQVLAAAVKETGPALFQFRQLEIEKERVTRWNGAYPTYYMATGSNGSGPNLLLNVPSPGTVPQHEAPKVEEKK